MKRGLLALITGAVVAAVFAPPAGAQFPAYMPKPNTWTSKLATHQGPFVTDAQLGQWIWKVQTNNGALMQPRFSIILTFTQCYGGGFLTELMRNPRQVKSFGANSASRYYEPSSYDATNSFYAEAWKTEAADPMKRDDKAITERAYARLLANPAARAQQERAQYLDDDPLVNPPPQRLDLANRKFAILFAGQPDGRDAADVRRILDVLTDPLLYNYNRMNIRVLYGDGNAPVGAGFAVDGPATAQGLEQAFSNWLDNALGAPGGAATQVFFWAGDHGAADFPFLMSVDYASIGRFQPAPPPQTSAVFVRWSNCMPVGNVIYEAGGGTNTAVWEATIGDVDAIAFSEQNVREILNPQKPPGMPDEEWQKDKAKRTVVYFSVDRASRGALNSDVNREIQRRRSAGSDVFAATANSNRLVFDGADSLGLIERPDGGDDELDALSLRNTTNARVPFDPNVPNPNAGFPDRPLFFSLLGTPSIWVYDPPPAGPGATYLYTDLTTLVDATGKALKAPEELDALALWDDGVRIGGKLVFDGIKDYMFFSVGRQEINPPWNGFSACDILKVGPDGMGASALALWRPCFQIGLMPGADNLDALEIGLGNEGQPEPPSYSPSYPYYSPYSPIVLPPPEETTTTVEPKSFMVPWTVQEAPPGAPPSVP